MVLYEVLKFLILPALIGLVYWYQAKYYSFKGQQERMSDLRMETYLVVCSSISIELFGLLNNVAIPTTCAAMGITVLAQVIGVVVIRRMVK